MTCTQTMLCSSAGKLYFVDCKWLNNLTVGPSGFLGFFYFWILLRMRSSALMSDELVALFWPDIFLFVFETI
jgi:hypothetical protein